MVLIPPAARFWTAQNNNDTGHGRGLLQLTKYHARNRTREEIRTRGAVFNLNEGLETTIHGIQTRLVVWPGVGPTESALHTLIVRPGDESEMYNLGMSDEAMVCLSGKGEVFIRGEWGEMAAGDVAYFPAGTTHALRNARKNEKPFVLATCISPPNSPPPL